MRDEVLNEAKAPDFAAVQQVWGRMTPGWIEILSDDATPELAQAVHRLLMAQTLK